MVTIYNSLTGRKAELEPVEPGRVGVYVCGITAYDYCHIGHARVLVAFDVAVRYLRFRGYAVTYVRNITDIDDKIIDRARENGEPWREVTERFIAAMHEDAATLGLRAPDYEPRATEHLDAIVAMIQELEARGFAYVTDSGDVYYDVSRFPEYGKLSGERPEALRAGARVDVDTTKSDPLDFALWKAAKPGEPAWPSPWGPGRPGWHIECSAMSTSCLGEHFDIHGGGLDLKFPHHENEIAQSEAANATAFVNTWMHVGFVEVDAEKMSKSLGNFSTIRDVLRGYQPETVRYFMLASHYRSPLNYTDRNLDTARAGLERLYTALRGLDTAARPAEESAAYEERFLAAMDDDFNTPQALAVLFDLAREVNRLRNEGETSRAGGMAAALIRLGEPLGLLQDDPEAYLKGAGPEGLDPAEIEERIAERARARAQRDWETADRIRDQLTEHGIELEDTAEGTIWRRR